MIGNIPDLTNFTSEKESYTLYIPLQFWFCGNPGMALPCISLLHSDIKINVEFHDVEKCYKLTPTHYIKCRDDIVNFDNKTIEFNFARHHYLDRKSKLIYINDFDMEKHIANHNL